MAQYILKRLLFILFTFYVLATLMFFMFRMLPGDPTITVISSALNPNAQEAMKRQYGLDKPLHQQYLAYLKNIVNLDFGYSFHHSRKVSDMISGRMLNTILLILPSMIAAYFLGVLGGSFIAWRRGSKTEIGAVIVSTAFQSAPAFWLSMLAIFVSQYIWTFSLWATSSLPVCITVKAIGKYISVLIFYIILLFRLSLTLYTIYAFRSY